MIRSALLDLYDSADGKEERCERAGEKRGVECDGKSGRRDEGGRVTTRSSHQRLFCGFDSHWFANDGHFPHPSSFRRYSLPSSSLPILPFAHQNSTLGSLPFTLPPTEFATRVFHPYSCFVYFQGFLILH